MILTIAFAVVVGSTLSDSPDGKVPGIRFADEHAGTLLISSILQALAMAALALPLGFLYRAIAYRRPEMPRLLRNLVVGAPLIFGALLVIRQVALNAEISDLVPDLDGLGKEQAEDLVDDRLGTTSIGLIAGISFAAQLAVGAAVVLLANHARKVGLMSNFIGILGIIVGVLIVLPIFGSLPIVQLFWMGALAALFLGRWPGGRGPAWETGEADPWPSAQETRELREAEAEAESGGGRERRPARAARDEEPEPEDQPDEPGAPQHPRSKKRKRKRKR